MEGAVLPRRPAGFRDAALLRGRLGAVEINNTFYRLPKRAVLEGWAAQTPPGFRFAIKASRRITHFARLKETAAEPLGYLLDNLSALGAKLGPVLFQLPPNMKKDLPRLQAFLDRLPRARQAAFEFRHPSWFEDDVFAALRAAGAALCIAESGDAALTAPRVATAAWGYLRLRRDDYDARMIDAWAATIRDQDWREAYVFFKHEDSGAAPKLALELGRRLAGSPAAGVARRPARRRPGQDGWPSNRRSTMPLETWCRGCSSQAMRPGRYFLTVIACCSEATMSRSSSSTPSRKRW